MNEDGGRPFGRNVRPVSIHKGLRLDVSKVTLHPYQTRLLLLSTKDTDDKALSTAKWTSSNTDVAAVTQGGWVEAKSNGTATITVTNTYGLSISCKVTVADSTAPSGVKLVDLGLPSGTLWANMNVGASKQEQFGSYYAWGETSTKSDYNWENYRFGAKSKLTRYNVNAETGTVDDRTSLMGKDDAAYVMWGSNWRMPTQKQYQELIDNCTLEDTIVNGVDGFKIKGPSGNWVFFPATGYYTSEGHKSETRFLSWTRSLNTEDCNNAYQANASSVQIYMNGDGSRAAARVVRPVSLKLALRLDITEITMNPHQVRQLHISTKDTDEAVLTTAKWASSDSEIVAVDANGWVSAVANGTATITVTNNYGATATCKITVTDPSAPENVELIDLGLPSCTLWSNMNVGASKPEESGSYFSWGETSAKTDHQWSDYRFVNINNMVRYNVDAATGTVDNKEVLMDVDDAAYVLWGNDWCMPTKEQYQELIDNCTVEETTSNGVSGFKITGPSGNTIFFPVTGYYAKNGFSNENQFISWTRSLNDNNCNTAYQAITANDNISLNESGSRAAGRVIRPVSSSNKAVRIEALTFADDNIVLAIGRTKSIMPIITPANATAQNFDWSSSNSEIVEVDGEGNVTAIASGHATITVMAKENQQITASFEVNVVLLGDANNDGKVDIVDVVTIYIFD